LLVCWGVIGFNWNGLSDYIAVGDDIASADDIDNDSILHSTRQRLKLNENKVIFEIGVHGVNWCTILILHKRNENHHQFVYVYWKKINSI
jgi:hypothetical protein